MPDNNDKRTSENKLKTNQAYLNKLDDIKVRVPSGYKAKIQDFAKGQGLSVNQLFIKLINEDAKKKDYDLEIPSGIKSQKSEA